MINCISAAIAMLILIVIYINCCNESFYIEPNTIIGGAMPESGMIMTPGGHYQEYNAPLELEGPGNAAWSGY
jgi:hypothetical protein